MKKQFTLRFVLIWLFLFLNTLFCDSAVFDAENYFNKKIIKIKKKLSKDLYQMIYVVVSDKNVLSIKSRFYNSHHENMDKYYAQVHGVGSYIGKSVYSIKFLILFKKIDGKEPRINGIDKVGFFQGRGWVDVEKNSYKLNYYIQ